MKRIFYLILSLIVVAPDTHAVAPDGGNGSPGHGDGDGPRVPTPPVPLLPGSDPDVPILMPHIACPFTMANLYTGETLEAELSVSSNSLCIDFGANLVGVESIEVKNLTAGGRARSFYGYTATLFNIHFSGDTGTWQVKVNTSDGKTYVGTFYYVGSSDWNPGYDNNY